jgi:hypothetical protein
MELAYATVGQEHPYLKPGTKMILSCFAICFFVFRYASAPVAQINLFAAACRRHTAGDQSYISFGQRYTRS